MLLLDKPVEQASDSDEISYCHTHLTLALCGAYKPVECGIPYILAMHQDLCPKCKRPTCPDCEEIMHSQGCPRCGL
jgi:tRNA(Ile2) C34 agmatinyltransferase TiaS